MWGLYDIGFDHSSNDENDTTRGVGAWLRIGYQVDLGGVQRQCAGAVQHFGGPVIIARTYCTRDEEKEHHMDERSNFTK